MYSVDNIQARPLADKDLISYRCKGLYDWIMIGATSHDDAFKEALRSYDEANRDDLQIWHTAKKCYVSIYIN